MRTKSILLMLMLFLGVTSVQADKYYKPTTRATELTVGAKYMIYNTAIDENGGDRTGFLYNSGTRLLLNKNKKRSEHIYNDCHVWTLEEGTASGIYYLKSQSTGTYVNINGNTTNAEGQALYIVDWTTAKSGELADKLSGVRSENEEYTTVENADIASTNDKVYLIHDNNRTTWNGDTDGFTTWQTGHPYAFYKVEEVTQENYTNISLLNIYSRCDLYSVQKIYGYIQRPLQITSNMTFTSEGGYENLLDGDYSTYNVTNWMSTSGEYHYYQVDLGESIDKLHVYMKRRSDGRNAPTVLTLSMSADGETWNEYGSDIATGLGNNVEYFSDVIELGAEYRYLRFTAKERSTDNMCMGLSEFYLLPDNDVTKSGSLEYFDHTLPVSATAEGYNDVIAIREANAPGVKLLSGVPMAGYEYHIYADAYDAVDSIYVNRDVSVADGALLANRAYSSVDDSFVWVCESAGDGKLAFKSKSTGKYLANGTVQDDVYAWTYNTDLTHRHGVPLLDDSGNYLTVKNDGSAWVATQTAVADQTMGDNCYDYVFLPYERNASERAFTVSLCAAAIAARNATLTVDGETQSFPYSYVGDNLTMPVAGSVCPDFYEFVGFFKGETNLGKTLEVVEIENGDNIEARYRIVAPFEYTTNPAKPKYYRIKNIRRNKYANYVGDEAAMTQVTDVLKSTLFYFTGEATDNAYVVKIHNATTTNILNGITSWNATGRNYYVQPYKNGTTGNAGYAITYEELNATNNPYTAWNDLNNASVTEYSAIDAGSTWVFEAVTDFSPYAVEAVDAARVACEAFIAANSAFLTVAEQNDFLAAINALTVTGVSQDGYYALLEDIEELRATWVVSSAGFPELSTADDVENNTMKWYSIDNVRAKKGNVPYLSNFTGEATGMTQVQLPATPNTMFYFTGEKVTENGIGYLQNVKIHTYNTDKLSQAPDKWTDEGTAYFIQEYNRAGYEGYIIAMSKYADPASTLDAKNTSITQNWTNAPSPWGTTDEATYPALTVPDGATVRKAETSKICMTPGTVTVTFTYSAGAHQLTILGVELLDTGGNVVNYDYHVGTAGGNHSKNSYTLTVTSAAQYTLRYWVGNIPSSSELTRTNGNIAITTNSAESFLALSSTTAIGWSDYNGNGSNIVANYKCNDDGSTWQFTAVKNYAAIFDIENLLNDALADINDYNNTSNIVSDDANNEEAAEYETQLEELQAQYEALATDATFAQCEEILNEIETIREAYSALFVAKQTVEFTQTRDDVAYWLTATSTQSVATQAANLHTNAWRIDHVSSGFYTIYNEASNKYLAKATTNQGSVIALTDEAASAGVWKFINDDSGNLLIKSNDVENSYLCIADDNKNVKTTSDNTLARAHWNITVTDDVTIDEALYTKAAQVVWNKMNSINENFGLVQSATMYSSNAEAAEGGLAALLDGDVTTSFLSATSDNAVYLQADLGETGGVASLYAYMRARSQNAYNRPIRYTVQAANSNDFSDAVTIGSYETNLNNMSIFFSDVIGEGNTTPYRYWRFTFDATNCGTMVVGLSEFLLLQNIEYMNTFVPAVNEFYDTKLCDNDTEGLDDYDNNRTITSASINLLKADIAYYLDRYLDRCAAYEDMTVGQFDQNDYDALQAAHDACNAENWETMYNMLDAFLNSYNGPVYYIYSAYDDGFTHDRAITYGEITQAGETSTKDHLRYMSKWDYEQLYYPMPTKEYVDITAPEVANSTLVPDFRHYKTNRKFMGRDFVEFIPIEGWKESKGQVAYKIDTNNGKDSTYIDVAERGLELSEAHKKEITLDTNRQGAWYITYVCDRKHLTQLYNVKMEYDLDGDDYAESIQMLDVINEIYNQWRTLDTRIKNDANGDRYGLNKYYWNAEVYTVDRRDEVYDNAKKLLQAEFHHIATRVLEKESTDPDYYSTQFTTMLNNLKLMVANYTMNQPTVGHYYRFRGIDENSNKRDKYMTSKVQGNRFVVDSELSEANVAETIFYLQNDGENNHLLAYDNGRFVGTCHENQGYGGDTWTFEKIGEVSANIPPTLFAGSVSSPASMAYSIKSGNVYLYCGDAHVDRGSISNGKLDADYWRYDWAVELVEYLPVEFSDYNFMTFYTPVEVEIPEGVTAYTAMREAVSDGSDIDVSSGENCAMDANVFRLRIIYGNILPAGTPVLLKCDAEIGDGETVTYNFPINNTPKLTSEEDIAAALGFEEGEENLFRGSHETNCIDEIEGYTHYVLSKHETAGIGLFKVAMKAASSRSNTTYADAVISKGALTNFLCKPHRAYLPKPNGEAQQAVYLFAIAAGEYDDVTDIDNTGAEKIDVTVDGGVYDMHGRRVEDFVEPGIYIVNGKKVLVK